MIGDAKQSHGHCTLANPPATYSLTTMRLKNATILLIMAEAANMRMTMEILVYNGLKVYFLSVYSLITFFKNMLNLSLAVSVCFTVNNLIK